jgi:DNA-3-methyladenine glycosylase II
MQNLKLKPRNPFNFELCSQIFSDGHPQIRRYEKGYFWQLVRIGNDLVLVVLHSTGTKSDPEMTLNLESEQMINPRLVEKISSIVSHIYNLELDLDKFYNDLEEDGVIERIISQLWGLKNPLTPTIFEALIDSVIEQQISLKVAHTLQNRVTKRFGDWIELNGSKYYTYPSPENLYKIEPQDLRDCGLTYRKAEYIIDISKAIFKEEIGLENMTRIKNTPELIEELCGMRGVGIWTAELTVLRSLGRYDAIPGDDVALRRIMSNYYCGGEAVTPSMARQIAAKWGDWKGLASFYLELAEMNEIII